MDPKEIYRESEFMTPQERENVFLYGYLTPQNIRGEQPDVRIDSEPGALRGENPLSETERSEV